MEKANSVGLGDRTKAYQSGEVIYFPSLSLIIGFYRMLVGGRSGDEYTRYEVKNVKSVIIEVDAVYGSLKVDTVYESGTVLHDIFLFDAKSVKEQIEGWIKEGVARCRAGRSGDIADEELYELIIKRWEALRKRMNSSGTIEEDEIIKWMQKGEDDKNDKIVLNRDRVVEFIRSEAETRFSRDFNYSRFRFVEDGLNRLGYAFVRNLEDGEFMFIPLDKLEDWKSGSYKQGILGMIPYRYDLIDPIDWLKKNGYGLRRFNAETGVFGCGLIYPKKYEELTIFEKEVYGEGFCLGSAFIDLLYKLDGRQGYPHFSQYRFPSDLHEKIVGSFMIEN